MRILQIATRTRKALLTLLYCLTSSLHVLAQDVVAPPPQAPLLPQIVQDALNAQSHDDSSLQSITAASPEENPLSVGPVTLIPHFAYRFLYGTGIQAAPGHQSITAISSLSPGILLDAGTHWSFDYTPTWSLYSNPAFKDTVDESATLVGAGTFSEWNLQFSQAYSYSSDPQIETGMQTNLTDYVTKFGGSYVFNSNASIDSSITQDYRIVLGYPDTLEWSTLNWLNYQLSPRLRGGIGGGFGYVDQSQGTNEFFVQPQIQLSLQATDKITITAHGGMENRRFIGSSEPSLNSPIYDISVQYQPEEQTKFTLSGDELISPAYFQDQTTRSTQWGASFQQRLLKRLYLSATANRQIVSYISSVALSPTARKDNQASYSVRLSTSIRKINLTLLYQNSRNSSSFGEYGYSSAQFGFELGYRY